MNSNKQKAAMNLMGFLPALVVQYYTQHEQELPAKQHFKSVVMFTDISGFTNLTETLQQLGPEGCEITAFVINRYMELLVKAISKSGGDILKFAGDAMIVVWPPSTKTDAVEIHEELRTVCRMALQNALDIQSKLNDTCMLNNLKLSVKIGFGVGDINIIYVGGVFGRSEYLATGEPLVQAFSSEHCASKGGETIVSKEVYSLVRDFFHFDEVPDKPGFYFLRQIMAQFKVKMKAEALLIKNSISSQQFEKIKNQIQMYVPAALKPFIEINQEKWGSELRRVTTLFISLGIDLSDARTDQGLQRIQNVIRTVQKCVYMYEGSLNKLLMDDKGSTLIVVFGLPPVSHQNDSVRGIQSAFLLEQELRKIKCKCAIGISTGVAFCGVIGTSGSRREYSILGDCVNLSARLMQMATQPLSPVILIDETTAQDAQQKIHSIFWAERKVKGKEKGVQIFEPLHNFDDFRKVKDISTHYQSKVTRRRMRKQTEDDEELENTLSKSSFSRLTNKTMKKLSVFNNFDSKLGLSQKLQSMPTTVRVKDNFGYDSPEGLLVGVDNEVKTTMQFLQSFLDEFKWQKQVASRILIIEGAYGIGKSYLIKNVLTRLEQTNQSRYKKTDLLEIFISQLNPASKTKFINSGRIIFRNVFLSLAQKYNKSPNLELIQSIYDTNGQVLNVIADILSLGINEIDLTQQKDEHLRIKELKEFILKLFSLYLNQEPNKEPIIPQINSEELDIYDQSMSLFILIDDMQDTDDTSMILMRHVMKHFNNVMFIGLVRNVYKEFSAFTPNQNLDGYKEGVNNLLKLPLTNKQISLSGLKSPAAVAELLEKYFRIKAFVCPEEAKQEQKATIFSRTKRTSSINDQFADIVEQLNKVRDPLIFWESKSELENMDINTLCINYLYVITRGHPLYIINLMNNLLNYHQITFDEKREMAVIHEKFKIIMKHEEWLQIDVPLISLQINGPMIDKLPALQQLILKQACVIGNIFDIQTLNYINAFKEQLSTKVLLEELNKLIEQNVIEIMIVEEDNQYYRFTHAFYRELLYQRMTYSQRRSTHVNTAFALQKIPQPFEFSGDKEYKRLEFHWNQSSNRVAMITNEGHHQLPTLTLQEKKSVIIKKIKQLIDSNQHRRSIVLKSGYIMKRSEKGITWNWRYSVVDTQSLMISQEDDNPDHCLSIPLKSVQWIEGNRKKDNNSEYYGLTVNTASWSRGGQIFDESKNLYFAVETEDELNEWVTYLEFTKAYAVYIDFVNNFGRISFPITFTEFDFLIKVELESENRKVARIGMIDKNSSSDRIAVRYSKNVGSRPTMVGTKRYQSRKSSIFAEGVRGSTTSSQVNGNNNIVTQQQDYQLLKDRLRQFILKSQQQLYSHLICCISNKLAGYDVAIRLGQQNMFQQHQLILIKNHDL